MARTNPRGVRRLVGIAGAWLLLAGAVHASDLPLMPMPRAVTEPAGAATLVLSGPFHVVFASPPDARLERAAARFEADVAVLAGFPSGKGGTLTIRARPDPGAGSVNAIESYRLTIDGSGAALEADGSDAVLRGLATLRQLIRASDDGFSVPFVAIEDQPRFRWRGLMIDTARHFVELETLKRQIDMMERVKLNVLHFHISDNEGFRIESLRYPRLTQVVGGGRFYTQDEVRELVAYASDRGVRIVPEIDLPGHTGAILAAYPELSAGPIDPSNRIQLMGAAMDPAKAETYVFIQSLLEEMTALFPDAYFHVGGDEVSPAAWTSNPAIQAYMAENGVSDTTDLQDRFFQRVVAILTDMGKIPMGWEEVAHRPIDDRVVVQAWRSSQATAHITGQGNPAVVSAGYYLDLLWPGLDHYGRDPLDVAATPPDSPEKIIGPAPERPLSDEQTALVLGAEAALWSETISDEMIDGRLWPRTALLAERFWSPAEVRDEDAAARRVVVVHEGLRAQGLADLSRRHRMAARLAPSDVEAVETLAAVTAPVRNMGRLTDVFAAFRSGRPLKMPVLTGLADIAAPDSIEIYRLQAWTADWLAGDTAGGASLKAALERYRDNHARFVAVARGIRPLEEAIPISEDVSRLASLGLEAMDITTAGTPPSAEWRAEAQALFDRQTQAQVASSSAMKVIVGAPQPPALLLIALTPVIERLVVATER